MGPQDRHGDQEGRRRTPRPRYREVEVEVRLKELTPPSGAPSRTPSSTRVRKQRRRRVKERRRRVAVLVPLLLGMLYGAYVLVTAAFAYGGEEPETATVTVREGDTLAEVADELERTGVVGSATFFKVRARLAGGETGVKPGAYRLERGESTEGILATLSSEEEDISTYAVTIPEGLTIRQTAGVVAEAGGGVPAAEFESAAASSAYDYAFLAEPAVRSTEGFLFPKRYEFQKGTGARSLVDRMLEQYLRETAELDFAAAKEKLDLTEYQIVIVASLVEKEAANPEERALVAAVIYNRLREDMPLQIDASVQYAIGEPKERLSLDDLQVESPYNTYENRGLPPGPIASPSKASLQAALEPARTDYLYYVLEAGGKKHFFTNDYDEFLKAKEKAGR